MRKWIVNLASSYTRPGWPGGPPATAKPAAIGGGVRESETSVRAVSTYTALKPQMQGVAIPEYRPDR